MATTTRPHHHMEDTPKPRLTGVSREQALAYVGHWVDDAQGVHTFHNVLPIPAEARLVGWQAGFEPMFVAVTSYLPGITLDADEAEELARDYLAEIGWFGEGGVRDADYVL